MRYLYMRKINFFLVLLLSFFYICFYGNARTQRTNSNVKNLTIKQQSIIPIAAFTATGELEELKGALNEGLNNGLTVNEIKEILVHTYAYAGFPRSLNGINTFMSVLEEREKNGIKDEIGAFASPVPNNLDKNEYGENIRTALTRRTSKPAYQTFTPVIDTFLKEHLFADLFIRDNLDHLSREITTISILSNLGNVNAQLQSHMNITMNLGLTYDQMNNFIMVLEEKVSREKAENAQKVLDIVVESRKK